MAKSVNTKKIIKKRTKKIARFQSNRFIRVKNSWRRPHGIDGTFRKRERGNSKHVSIGFGSDKKTKFLVPSGFYKFSVHNADDLDMLLLHNKKYAVEIAHNVGARKRIEIVNKAKQMDLKVLNAHGRVIQQ